MSTYPQELTLAQLYEENIELRATLDSRTQEYTFLQETIATINSTQRKHDMLIALSALSQLICAERPLDDMLHSLATLTIQLMEADLCLVMLLDEKSRLAVKISSPLLHDYAFDALPRVVDDATWEQLDELHKHGFAEIGARELAALDPLKRTPYKTFMIAPLIAGSERLGVINCYSSKTQQYGSEDQLLLGIIANQVASAVRYTHLAELHTQRNLVKGFLNDLVDGTRHSEEMEDSLRQRANILGCDLKEPHLIALIEISHKPEHRNEENGDTLATDLPLEMHFQSEEERFQRHQHLVNQVQHHIQANYPGSVLYEQDGLLTCLIGLSDDPPAAHIKIRLQSLCNHVQAEYPVRLFIGIGTLCQSMADYHRGFTQAKEALQMGRSLNRNGGVTHFNDLGVYRYLYKFAQMDSTGDASQEQIEQIARYDAQHRAGLLDTLEMYLECAGNRTVTARNLAVHINTVRQRLERIQEISGADPDQPDCRFALQLALEVYKLRMSMV